MTFVLNWTWTDTPPGTSFNQQGAIYRFADCEIVFSQVTSSANPSGWGLTCLFGPSDVEQQPGSTIPEAILAIVPTTDSGGGISVPISRLDLTSLLTDLEYTVALWRTDEDEEKPLAVGKLSITTVPSPQ